MERDELLWRQYQQNVELYKFYMDLAVKFNVFYYAVTGAVFSFFFANASSPSSPHIKYSLLLPLVMSVAFAIFFVYGAVLTRVLRRETFAIRDALRLEAAPDVGVLSAFLYIFAGVFLLVAIGCGIVLCRY